MDIIFYKSTNEVNSFPKSLTDGVTISGSLRSECDILNPVIEFTGIGVDIPYNYCYIPTFKRYYFITEARSIRNDIVRLSMHVDVLQSWVNDILKQECIIARQEYSFNNNIEDNMTPLEHRVSYDYANLYSIDSDAASLPAFSIINNYPALNNEDKKFVVITANAQRYFEQPSSGTQFSGEFQNQVTASTSAYLTDLNGIDDVTSLLWDIDPEAVPYSSPSELVVKILVLPFHNNSLSFNTKIRIGNSAGNNPNNNAVSIVSAYPDTLIYDIRGKANPPYEDGHFLNYEPYTSHQLYVPFFGFVDIDSIHLYNGVHIKIFMDYTTGEAVLKILDNSTSNEIYSSSMKICIEIPVTSTNGAYISSMSDYLNSTYDKRVTNEYFSLARNVATTYTSTVSAIFSGKSGDISGVASNGLRAENSAISAIENIYNINALEGIRDAHINTLKMTPSSTNYTSNTTASSKRLTFLIRRNCIPAYPESYNRNVGRPSLKTETLSNLRGYTVVDDVHIKDINCTLSEHNLILSLLHNGVVITSNPVPEVPEEPSDSSTNTPSDDTSSSGTFTPVEPIEPITPIEPETKWLSPWSGSFRVTSTYGEKRTYTATDGKVYTDVHQGLDMVGIGDINIYSIAEGTVEHIGWQNASNPSAGFGYYCRVNTNGKLFYYAHMRADSSTLKVGDTISKGTKIGVMGSTGQVTGAHLHLEVRGSTASSSHENICSYTLLPNEIGTYE